MSAPVPVVTTISSPAPFATISVASTTTVVLTVNRPAFNVNALATPSSRVAVVIVAPVANAVLNVFLL